MTGKLDHLQLTATCNIGGEQQPPGVIPRNCQLFIDSDGLAADGSTTDPEEVPGPNEVSYVVSDGVSTISVPGDASTSFQSGTFALQDKGVALLAQTQGKRLKLHCEGLQGDTLTITSTQRGVTATITVPIGAAPAAGSAGTKDPRVASCEVVADTTTVAQGGVVHLEAVGLDSKQHRVPDAQAGEFHVQGQHLGGPINKTHFDVERNGNRATLRVHADCPKSTFVSYCLFGDSTDPEHVTSASVVITVV